MSNDCKWPTMSYQDQIRALLDDLGITRPPIDLRVIGEAFGVQMHPAADIPADAMLQLIGDRQTITLKRTAPPKRQRFSWAHEIGHVALNSRTGTSAAYRSLPTDDPIESECDKWAAELLMPTDMFLKMARPFGYRLSAVARLSRRFDVSREAVIWRLLDTHPEHCILTKWRPAKTSRGYPQPENRFCSLEGFSQSHGEASRRLSKKHELPDLVRQAFSSNGLLHGVVATRIQRKTSGELVSAEENLLTDVISNGFGDFQRVFSLAFVDRRVC